MTMMKELQMPTFGSHHLGIDDAKNIARVLQHMLSDGALMQITARRGSSASDDVKYTFKNRIWSSNFGTFGCAARRTGKRTITVLHGIVDEIIWWIQKHWTDICLRDTWRNHFGSAWRNSICPFFILLFFILTKIYEQVRSRKAGVIVLLKWLCL